MKNSRYLVLFTMTAMLCVMWVSVIGGGRNDRSRYDEYIKKACEHEEKEAYITAVDNYIKALEIDPGNYELMIKIAEDYLKCDDKNGFVRYCDMASAADRMADKPYILRAEYCISSQDYPEAIKILEAVPEAGRTENVITMLSEIKYKFMREYQTYADMKYFSGGYAAVKNENGYWGISDSSGYMIIPAKYNEMGGVYNAQADIIPVCENGEWYFADISGRRKYVPDHDYSFLGTYSDGYAPFEYNGKYGYMNLEYEESGYGYEYAGAFSEGVAAVRKNGRWALIDSELNEITDYIYDSIETDCYGFCIQNGVIHAVQNGEKLVIDRKGKRTDEKSVFSCGMTPVCKNGLWGYADENGETVIAPQFEAAYPFTESGAAGVKEDGVWHIIRLYAYK